MFNVLRWALPHPQGLPLVATPVHDGEYPEIAVHDRVPVVSDGTDSSAPQTLRVYGTAHKDNKNMSMDNSSLGEFSSWEILNNLGPIQKHVINFLDECDTTGKRLDTLYTSWLYTYSVKYDRNFFELMTSTDQAPSFKPIFSEVYSDLTGKTGVEVNDIHFPSVIMHRLIGGEKPTNCSLLRFHDDSSHGHIDGNRTITSIKDLTPDEKDGWVLHQMQKTHNDDISGSAGRSVFPLFGLRDFINYCLSINPKVDDTTGGTLYTTWLWNNYNKSYILFLKNFSELSTDTLNQTLFLSYFGFATDTQSVKYPMPGSFKKDGQPSDYCDVSGDKPVYISFKDHDDANMKLFMDIQSDVSYNILTVDILSHLNSFVEKCADSYTSPGSRNQMRDFYPTWLRMFHKSEKPDRFLNPSVFQPRGVTSDFFRLLSISYFEFASDIKNEGTFIFPTTIGDDECDIFYETARPGERISNGLAWNHVN